MVVIFNRRGKFRLFGMQGDSPQLFFLVEHPDLPIRKTLRRVLDLLTVMILKRLSESIFFQINKFTANLKIKRGGKFFDMTFNILKIIHSF